MTDDEGRSRSASDVAADKAILLIGMFLEDSAFAGEVRLVRARLGDLVNSSLDQQELDVTQLTEDTVEILWARARKINEELVEILSTRVEEIAVRGTKRPVDTPIAGQHIDANALDDLAQEAESMAARFGLKAPWVGYGLLLPDVVGFYFSAIWHDQNPRAAEVRVNRQVIVQAQYSPLFDKRRDVQRDIRIKAKDQLDAIDRLWSRGAGIGRHRTKPAAKQHLKWLFLRLKDPKTYTWARIADDSKTGVRTVRDAVEGLARDLQIELPLIPPGRPKKLRK